MSEVFDPSLPISVAKSPPADWYRSESQDHLERRRVLADNWQAVAHLDQLEQPGDYVSGCVGGEPWVVLRDESGTLRAFANICRHNGTQVAEGAGHAETLVCPYHGWAYDLQGQLKKAPRIAGIKGFDRDTYSLQPIGLQVFGPLVLVNGSGDATALDLDSLTSDFEATGWQDLVRVERRSYELFCNWKVFIDNYLDGGYHVPFLHRDLAAELDLSGYETECFDSHAVQRVASSSEAGERLSGEALYAWVYPNLMINRYGSMMDINVVTPMGPEKCRVDFDWYMEPDLDPALIHDRLTASEQVQDEDIAICESLQVGLGSQHYRPGPYAPRVEHAKYLFHRLVAADLLRSPDQ